MWDFSAIDRLLGEYSEANSGCPVTHSYAIDDVSKLLCVEDWEILDVRKDHIFPVLCLIDIFVLIFSFCYCFNPNHNLKKKTV